MSVIVAQETDIHVGDIGTVFEVHFQEEVDGVDQALPIDNASAIKILFEKPDGTGVEKDGTHVTDGTDGKAKYTSASGDIDQAGVWRIEGKVTLPNGTWSSEIKHYRVYDVIAIP